MLEFTAHIYLAKFCWSLFYYIPAFVHTTKLGRLDTNKLHLRLELFSLDFIELTLEILTVFPQVFGHCNTY